MQIEAWNVWIVAIGFVPFSEIPVCLNDTFSISDSTDISGLAGQGRLLLLWLLKVLQCSLKFMKINMKEPQVNLSVT